MNPTTLKLEGKPVLCERCQGTWWHEVPDDSIITFQCHLCGHMIAFGFQARLEVKEVEAIERDRGIR